MNIALDIPSENGSADALRLAPLGVPLRIECAPAASGPIAAACRGWEGRANGPSAPLRLRLRSSHALSGTGEVAIRADSTRITLRGPGVIGRAEVGLGFADCLVSSAYLESPAALRQEVLDPLVLMLLTRRDRTPLHAAAFIADDVAILLAGRAGAGKSCLARAADTAGFQVLSEDTVYVQLTPRLTVWGWPTVAHLLPRDAPDPTAPIRERGGRVKHVVALRSASQAAIACNRAVLCLLSRAQDGEPALGPIPPAEVEDRLWPLDEGFDLLPGPIAKVLARLAADGAWDLRLSADPAQAVRLLAADLPRLEGRRQPPG
jgi:hypothetical protein